MADEKKIIPPPTIKPSTPAPPPPTPSFETADLEPPAVEGLEVVEEITEEKEELAEPSPRDDVEVDLVNRFLGALVDSLVAGGLGYLATAATGVSVVQYVVVAIVLLTRDSLPFLEGQSIGKKVMKTKAVKLDGSSLSNDWVTGAIRNILLAVPIVGLIECFILLTRSGNPRAGFRLGDDWAKTKVISVDED